ncbi:TetR/AcrR family transcriptional regulator [Roseomonas sp. CAU 1739]|uniref:TetR/AcrR family transcriptional regulator n=1 Tax=Roseomonas sp. CAU 1739 TaxID=3140364 RepID=UPI00325B0105
MLTLSTSNRPYHHGDLRAALLDAADALVEKGGDGALSLREAARAAGVSATAAYRHFADKEALLAALAVRHFRDFGAALADAGAQGGLGARGRAYVRFALARPGRFRLMFGGLLARAEAHPELRAASRATFDALSGVAGSEDGALRAWAFVHGLTHLLLDGALHEADTEALIARLVIDPPARA